MGGTFNPIHIGHMRVAGRALDALDLNEVWFIPTGISYMKSPAVDISSHGDSSSRDNLLPDGYSPSSLPSDILPGRERLFMTKLAVMDNEAFRCLDIEVKREGYTYSYETMEHLKGIYSEDDFYFIVGADCLFAIESWKNPDRLLKCCTLVVFMREGAIWQEMEERRCRLEQKFQSLVILLPSVNLSVSSTEIRRRIREGRSVSHLVPDRVLAYIRDKGFYCEKSEQFGKEEKRKEQSL